MLVETLAVSRRSLSLPTYVQGAMVNENGAMMHSQFFSQVNVSNRFLFVPAQKCGSNRQLRDLKRPEYLAKLGPELPVGADRFAPEDSSTMQSGYRLEVAEAALRKGRLGRHSIF